ncbi:hypothetical protein ABB37_01231 [Leptomonas pyrrhocoris]|uniref:Uncharacterized protein n=1 Tax=Leptomonas pyrrhocoris TaxID=157538 RepID=A0A0N0VH17_LEPPY|nr:hypothetical protein ABB37_01231 [Leptomonas pyrrhocoris]XP_015663174.1 hypothetical protein ABB37_01231 [Leptomonas pyrrhocoris]KPA84734.1 hypothetical protein ABB37_01231 [Leptomonas pyrrhocoris]KPA84735.1 hypothetical protein ABB37_01231 [Leptomonas pyrrhocoris]|eukprot:XP_015663173.1 hypothetical protein ABB37_01231 [Leptomonas pyrrhocoris]
MSAIASPAVSTETYCGLPVYALRDVLSQLRLPPPFKAADVSGKWRCVLAPSAEASATITTAEDLLLSEEELMPYLEAGVPVRGHAKRAAQAHAGCGESSVDWLTKGNWNAFPKPQIALRRGWGAPGTDMQDSSFHKLVASFHEVLHHSQEVEVPLTEQEAQVAAAAESESDARNDDASPVDLDAFGDRRCREDEVLDLQLFHRGDGCPAMPILGEKLVWPSYIDDGALCDTATWVSQRGMVRHWHLNDSGEFVMQAALPLSCPASPLGKEEQEEVSAAWLHEGLTPGAKKMLSLMCPDMSSAAAAATSSKTTSAQAAPAHHVAAMVTIFAPKGGYDWVLHDDEATMRGNVVALDLFATPDEALPAEAAVLPVLAVAVLESGGAPLIVPPNLAQLSIALEDCVVVEQRRVSNLWLDDVSYFLQRCAGWQSNPMIYAYLQQNLQDDAFLAGQLIPLLIQVFEEHGGDTAYHAAVRRRAVSSLFALTSNEKHYGASEATRRSLMSLLRGGNAPMHAVLQSSPHPTATTTNRTDVPATLEAWLALYWNMSWCWPKPGCVLRAPNVVYPFGAKLTSIQQTAHYVPVVYPPQTSSPVYGTEKDSLEGTVRQYFEMKQMESKPKDLMAYLRTRKQPPDDLLDELF